MKILYLESRKRFKEINLSLLDTLPGKIISVAATIQYLDLIRKIKEYLEQKGKKVIIKKGPAYVGHTLGCNSSAFDKNADTLLLISDGKFHAMNNALQLDKEIYIFSGQSLEKVEKHEIEKIKARTRAKIKKFLASEKAGILVSVKPGQNFKPVKAIKKKIENLGKKVYIFESDSVSLNELENFQLPIYINTACFGLGMDDSRIVNLQDILEFI